MLAAQEDTGTSTSVSLQLKIGSQRSWKYRIASIWAQKVPYKIYLETQRQISILEGQFLSKGIFIFKPQSQSGFVKRKIHCLWGVTHATLMFKHWYVLQLGRKSSLFSRWATVGGQYALCGWRKSSPCRAIASILATAATDNHWLSHMAAAGTRRELKGASSVKKENKRIWSV